MEKNASILVVDDDKEIADLVEIYLVNDGYQVLNCLLYTSPSPRD